MATVEQVTEESRGAASVRRASNQRRLSEPVQRRLVVWAILCQTPLLLLHFWGLWLTRPHFGLFPIFVAALALIGIRRVLQHSQEISLGDIDRATRRMLIGSACLHVATFVLQSPALGLAAFALSLPALLQLALGARIANRLLGVCFGLLLLVPLPRAVENDMLVQLQRWSAGAATVALDQLEIEHALVGTTIHLVGGRFSIEEACSGMNSVFALMAVAVVMCVLVRAGWLTYFIMLAMAAVVALIGNAARIVSLVVLEAWFAQDATTGLIHDLHGLLFATIEIAFLISGFFAVRFFFKGIDGSKPQSMVVRGSHGRERVSFAENPLVTVWNFLFDGARSRIRIFRENADDRSSRRAEARMPSRTISKPVAGVLTIVFSLTFVAQTAVAIPSMQQPSFAEEEWTLGPDAMPEVIGSYRLVSYETAKRGRDSEWGSFTETWEYQTASGHTMLLSCAHPFYDWHELSRCYRGLGCDVKSYRVTSTSNQGDSVEARLSDPTGVAYDLRYTYISHEGEILSRPFAPIPTVDSNPLWEQGFSFATRRVGRWVDVPRSQLQLLSIGAGDDAEAETIFAEATKVVVETFRNGG